MRHITLIAIAILMVAMLIVAGCTHQASGQKITVEKDSRLHLNASGCWFNDGTKVVECTEKQKTQAIVEKA